MQADAGGRGRTRADADGRRRTRANRRKRTGGSGQADLLLENEVQGLVFVSSAAHVEEAAAAEDLGAGAAAQRLLEVAAPAPQIGGARPAQRERMREEGRVNEYVRKSDLLFYFFFVYTLPQSQQSA